MAHLAEETKVSQGTLVEYARIHAIREWEQSSRLAAYREGGCYSGIAYAENLTSGFEIADDYTILSTGSDTLSEFFQSDDKHSFIDDKTSDETESCPSLIEKLSPYFRKMTIENELQGYLQFEDGWDGVNSVSPSESAIKNAISFLHRFSDVLTQPTPMVAADGEVGLYWRYQNAYIELEFAGDGMMFGYARDPNGKETFIDDVLLDSSDEMEKAIATIFEIVAEFPLDDD